MAKAEKIEKTVTKTTYAGVTLRLDPEEAAAIRLLTGRITGQGGLRDVADRVWNALVDAGIPQVHTTNKPGSVAYFQIQADGIGLDID